MSTRKANHVGLTDFADLAHRTLGQEGLGLCAPWRASSEERQLVLERIGECNQAFVDVENMSVILNRVMSTQGLSADMID